MGAGGDHADIPLVVQLYQLPGQVAGVMAHQAVFHRGHRAADDLHPQGLHGLPVAENGLCSLLGIALHHCRGNGGGIGQAQVKQPRAGVLEQGADVVGHRVALGFAILGHDVADIDLQGVGLPDRLHDAIHQQIGDDAGVQAAGPQDDHVRVRNGV